MVQSGEKSCAQLCFLKNPGQISGLHKLASQHQPLCIRANWKKLWQ